MTRIRPLFLLPLLLWAALCAVFLVWLLRQPEEGSPRVGEAFPVLENAAEWEFPAVVNVFASWCVPCQAEHPLLMEMRGREKRRYRLYGVAWKDLPEKSAAFLTRKGNPYDRVFQDGSGTIGAALGITGVPETFVVDGEGIVRFHMAGPLTPAMAKDIAALLEELR